MSLTWMWRHVKTTTNGSQPPSLKSVAEKSTFSKSGVNMAETKFESCRNSTEMDNRILGSHQASQNYVDAVWWGRHHSRVLVLRNLKLCHCLTRSAMTLTNSVTFRLCYFLNPTSPNDRTLKIGLRWLPKEPTIRHPWKFGEADSGPHRSSIIGMTHETKWNRSKT